VQKCPVDGFIVSRFQSGPVYSVDELIDALIWLSGLAFNVAVVNGVDQLTHSLVCLGRLLVDLDLIVSRIALNGGVAVGAASSAYLLAVQVGIRSTVVGEDLLLDLLLLGIGLIIVLDKGNTGIVFAS
jgi:hypothetical protein